MTAALTVTDLRFGYPDRPMWSAWSHAFPPGFTWLRGGNGSGKSTLLKLLAGAVTPQAGCVDAGGVDQAREPIAYRRRVFWCGPGALPFDHLTPLEYFAFMRGLYPAMDGRALEHHLDGFGLRPHVASVMRTLSTGTQRKVWLAASLSAGTAVTLLDEPLNALDASSRAHLRQSLARVEAAPSRLWIVASHEPFGTAGDAAHVLDLDADLAIVSR